MNNELLLGDEAVGLGAIHAGISGVYGYPGTPSTEIFEYVAAQAAPEGQIHARWSTNEKVAYEEALGMSWAGRRALVTMKHVGLNVAADAFVNSAVTGINGGLVLAVADDPGMHSSQNEQDSRALAEFAHLQCLEPRNQQEAYDLTRLAFDLSERFGLPVVLRLVTRLAHSRSGVATAPPRDPNPLAPRPDAAAWVLLPGHARAQFKVLLEKEHQLAAYAEETELNELSLRGSELGVISAGIASNYVAENLGAEHRISRLHVGAYPAPAGKLRRLVEHVDQVLVVEDGHPVIEKSLAGPLPAPIPVLGRLSGDLPASGELTPDLVRAALGIAAREHAVEPLADLPGRPPALCKGCSHADTYRALVEALGEDRSVRAFSDIGCYTLGAYPPFEAIGSCVCMGASVGMATGAAQAGFAPAVAVIGDSTFAHGGVTGLMSALHSGAAVTVIILDNHTVAMTGGQESLATGETLERLVVGLGTDPEHVRVIAPLPKQHAANTALIEEEIAHPGPSVIIARRACIHVKKKS